MGLEKILVYSLLFHRWTKLASTYSKRHGTSPSHHRCPWLPNLVHIACHQLETGIAKCFAALIVEGYPADELEYVGFRRRNHVVTGLPVHATGHIAELRRDRTRLVA